MIKNELLGTLKHRFLSIIFIAFLVLLAGCEVEQRREYEHYFLDGYDHLEFRDQEGAYHAPEEYIYSSISNGVRGYWLRDSSLTLYDTRSEENYSGYIRTFHRGGNNLQGEFKEGKMVRLRYWDRHRNLRMDANYLNNTGTLWYPSGSIAVSWNEQEMYHYNGYTHGIKMIMTDTSTFYYDQDGVLTEYSISTDTSFTKYYPDGTPEFYVELKDRRREGVTKSWYPNGQLGVIGYYKDGKETGTWIEYDSLGSEIRREVRE